MAKLTVEPINFSVVLLEPMFNDTALSKATGFFYSGEFDGKPNLWLVTNWHVFSGRNADVPSRIEHSKAARPNRLRVRIKSKRDDLGAEHDSRIYFHERLLELYDADNRALWYEHQKNGNEFDVAVANLGTTFEGHLVEGLDKFMNGGDMRISIGGSVRILGYPLGFAHFMDTPIWKGGVIASEPHDEADGARGRVVIDATTRQGMSGSPVILRAETHYEAENGQVICKPRAMRFIGVYASRPPKVRLAGDGSDESGDARHEVGYFYKSSIVTDIILNGRRAPDFGANPY